MSARKKKTRLPGRQLEAVHGVDPDGRPVVRHRVVDNLARLNHAGVITSEQYHAARAFEAAFAAAGLDPLRARPLETVAGSGCHPPQPTEWQALARRRVAIAIDALGGHHSPRGFLHLVRDREPDESEAVGAQAAVGWPDSTP